MQSYIYAPISGAGANVTEATGINHDDQVVGYHGSFTTSVPNTGFLYNDGSATPIIPPSAVSAQALGINPEGVIVGSYATKDASYGFIYDHGSYTTLAVPAATDTTAIGLNDNGAVVGTYTTGGSEHGFVYANNQYASIDVLGASTTVPLAINGLGEIVGYYADSSGTHGFVATPADMLQPGTTTFGSHQADGNTYIFAGISQSQADLPVMSFVHNSFNTLGTVSVGTAPTSPHYYGEIKQGKQSLVRIANGIKVTNSTLLIDQAAGARLFLDGSSSLNDGTDPIGNGTISASGGTLVLDGTITLGPGAATLLDLDKEKLQGHGTIIQQGEVGTIKVGRVAPGVKFQIEGGILAIDDPLSFKGTIGPLPGGSEPALGLFGVVEVYNAFDTARATYDASTGVLALLDSKGRDLADINFSGDVSGLHLTKPAYPSSNAIAINDQGTRGIGVGGNIPVSLVS